MNSENGEKKVLFINHSVRDGGPGRSLFYILKHIDRKIIRPFVLIPRDDIFSERLKEEGIYRDVIVDSRFPDGLFRPVSERFSVKPGVAGFFTPVLTVFLKTAYAAVNIGKIAALTFTCGGLLRERRIDLIHCNGTIAKITGAFIGLIHRRPVVWHVRNIQQTRFLKFVITRLASLSAVKKIICVSQATALQFGGNPKVRVIYNGIDPEDLERQTSSGVLRKEFSIHEDSIVIGNAGRVVPRKGYGHMIEVAAALLKNGDLRNRVKFVIVGDTPGFFAKNHLSEIKARVKHMGIADSFIFTGFRKDVSGCLIDFDIFLMPSNYPDPFPRSVIEAMSFAIPVTGFRVGGIEESVEDGVTGILSPPGDTSHMTESVRKLIDNKDLRKSMGQAGRRRAASLYSAKDKTAEVQSVLVEN
ncbi:glycosyltransferase family 4 protein [Candidatus Mycalebacterium sp.]